MFINVWVFWGSRTILGHSNRLQCGGILHAPQPTLIGQHAFLKGFTSLQKLKNKVVFQARHIVFK